MTRLPSLLGIAVLTSVAAAASGPPDMTDLYFGQAPPGNDPVVFAPGIISLEDRYEQFILYSPDEGQLVYGTTNFNWSAFSLHYMEMEDGQWTEPTTPPFLGESSDGLTACLSYDMRRAFFTSARPSYPPANIWMSERSEGLWSEPTVMGDPISSGSDEFEVSISRNGTLYFSSNRAGGEGDMDVYRAPLVDGGYPAIENLGPPVNTPYIDDLPFIAPDESYLVIGSKRPGGYGKQDLYVSFQVDGSWTEPVNLGPQVNSASYDNYPSVSPDGRYLFFSRRKSWVTSQDSDIYWVSSEVIHSLRPKQHIVAANGHGVGTQWTTEMAVVNSSQEESLTLDLTLLHESSSHDPCEEGKATDTPCPPVARVELGPFQEQWFGNLLDELFDYAGTAAVEISVAAGRPADAKLMTRISSSDGTAGAPTQGQGFESLNDDDAATPGDPATLVQLSHDRGFRTNLGLVNTGDTTATAKVSLLEATATALDDPLGEITVTLEPGGFRQLNNVFAVAGVTDPVEHALARVEVLTDHGRVLTYASVIDSWSQDPTTIQPARPHSGTLLVPAVARTAGAQEELEWRTALVIASLDDESTEVAVQLLASGQDNNDPPSVRFMLGPGEIRVFRDLVGELFAADDVTGALRVEAAEAIAVTSRTYTVPVGDPGGPTRGQGIPAVPVGETFGEGRMATIPGLERSADPGAGCRTNLGLLNVSMEEPVDVDVSLWGNGVTLIGSLSQRLPPGGFELLTDVYRHVSDEEVTRGFATVSTSTPGGRFYAFGSRVDNQSGDGTYVPGQ